MARRRGERGVARGCCLGLALGMIPVVALVVLFLRLVAAPDLGAPPDGPSHGGTPAVIAAAMAASVTQGLVSQNDTTFTLSERDLTVIAVAENPDSERFQQPQARIRNGEVVIDASTTLGPLGTVTTARLTVSLVTTAAGPHITADVVEVDVGQVTMPDWARSNFDPRGGAALNIDRFLGSAGTAALRQTLDCIRVTPDGLVVGFHRPQVAANPAVCGS